MLFGLSRPSNAHLSLIQGFYPGITPAELQEQGPSCSDTRCHTSLLWPSSSGCTGHCVRERALDILSLRETRRERRHISAGLTHKAETLSHSSLLRNEAMLPDCPRDGTEERGVACGGREGEQKTNVSLNLPFRSVKSVAG
ncbi:uncharacterized [Tachysurus ichikawai]